LALDHAAGGVAQAVRGRVMASRTSPLVIGSGSA